MRQAMQSPYFVGGVRAVAYGWKQHSFVFSPTFTQFFEHLGQFLVNKVFTLIQLQSQPFSHTEIFERNIENEINIF
jgi:hypothetical protein